MNQKTFQIFLFTILLILMPFCVIGSSQTEEQDQADSIVLAKEVTRLMQRSLDIGKIPASYFGSHFQKNTFDGGFVSEIFFSNDRRRPKMDQQTKKRFVRAAANWIWLSEISYRLSVDRLWKEDDLTVSFLRAPEKVERIMRRDVCLKSVLEMFSKEDDNLNVCNLKTKADVSRIILALERINAAYRVNLRNLPLLQNSEVLIEGYGPKDFFFEADHNCYCPEDSVCRGGFPPKTRFTSMFVPGFLAVGFTREKGKMTIVGIDLLEHF